MTRPLLSKPICVRDLQRQRKSGYILVVGENEFELSLTDDGLYCLTHHRIESPAITTVNGVQTTNSGAWSTSLVYTNGIIHNKTNINSPFAPLYGGEFASPRAAQQAMEGLIHEQVHYRLRGIEYLYQTEHLHLTVKKSRVLGNTDRGWECKLYTNDSRARHVELPVRTYPMAVYSTRQELLDVLNAILRTRGALNDGLQ